MNQTVSLFDFHSGDNIYSDLIENLQPGSLTRFYQEFLMLTMKKDRLRYFNKRAGRVTLKYDFWKALDFERDLEVASTHSDDVGI